MSRVEENKENEPRENQPQRQPIDRTPGKAEGDEKTVDEALDNQRDREDER